jgi:NHS family nucleoside permease-like MFS transporter
VDNEVSEDLRSSAQGLFMLMTNGLGASIGVIAAQKVVDAYTHSVQVGDMFFTVGDWSTAWYIFAAYALVIAVLFALLFKEKKTVK